MGLGVTISVGPVPDPQLTAIAAEVVVEQALGRTTRYSVVFSIDFERGDVTLLSDRRLAPGSELMIVAADGSLLTFAEGRRGFPSRGVGHRGRRILA